MANSTEQTARAIVDDTTHKGVVVIPKTDAVAMALAYLSLVDALKSDEIPVGVYFPGTPDEPGFRRIS